MDEFALIRLYRQMLRIRLVEERIVALYPEQEMRRPVHVCIGQEAVAAGARAALEHRDYVFSGHRSRRHYLAKGGDLKAMLAEIYGKATGCAGGKGGSMHLIDLAWKDRCPVALLEARLLAGGLASRSELDAMAGALQREIDAAVAFARESPFPDRQSMSAHVTAEQAGSVRRCCQ